MMADVNLALSAVILVIITLNLVGVWRAERNTKQTTKLIVEYRRELTWLVSRLDALETKVGKQSNGRR